MIVWFNQTGRGEVRRNDISVIRGFQGSIGLFFAVMDKLGQAPFLWWSEIMRVGVDFERKEVMLFVPIGGRNLGQTIPFADLLALSYADLVDRYMRPYAAAIARDWKFVQTADVIEDGGDSNAIETSLIKECEQIDESPKWYTIALTNILYVDAEVPWSGDDLVRQLKRSATT